MSAHSEIFEHTADIGLRMTADTLPELFVEAGRGLMGLMVDNALEAKPLVEIPLVITGYNHEELLADWLSEVLYLFEVRHLVLSDFAVKVTAEGIQAVVKGEMLDRQRHRVAHEVKAVTYHRLRVEHVGGQWVAEVILDI